MTILIDVAEITPTIPSNGELPKMVGGALGEDEEAQEHPGPLIFDDTDHHCRTLQALNMMRKNRHFCDVILHVRSFARPYFGCCTSLSLKNFL